MEVFDCGVEQNQRAVAAARDRGATPTQVLATLQWWREHRAGFEYPEVVLYRRLLRWADGPPEEGWPKFREGYVTPAEARARRRRLAVKRFATAAHALSPREREAWIARVRAREPDLDASDNRAVFAAVCEQLMDAESLQPTAGGF